MLLSRAQPDEPVVDTFVAGEDLIQEATRFAPQLLQAQEIGIEEPHESAQSAFTLRPPFRIPDVAGDDVDANGCHQ